MRPPGYAARSDLNLPPGMDLGAILPNECAGCVGADCDCADFRICPVCEEPIFEGEISCPGCETGLETLEV